MNIEQQKEFYNDYWSNPKAISNSKRIRIINIMDKLGKYCSTDQTFKILDLGCGDGRSLGVWSLFGVPVGIELSPKAVEFASKVYPKYEIKEGDATAIPFGDEEFDIVINQEVIEHVENQALLLKECYRVLKKNGKLILTTPNKYYFDRRKGGNYSNQPIEKIIDIHFLVSILNTVGFKILETESIAPKTGDFGIYFLVDKLIGRFRLFRSFTNYIKNRFLLSAHLLVVSQK